MKIRMIAALLGAVLAASCASTPSGPPSRADDICAIFDERPEWARAVARSERKWGAPAHVQMAIMWRESSFRAQARTPKKYILGVIPNGRVSSAYGFAQAIDGTWDWYREESGNSGADRDDFDDAADFVGWYMSKTRRSNGVTMHDAYNQYLAYHEGHAGHRRGTYRQKNWLMKAARNVASQAARYRGQLRRC